MLRTEKTKGCPPASEEGLRIRKCYSGPRTNPLERPRQWKIAIRFEAGM